MSAGRWLSLFLMVLVGCGKPLDRLSQSPLLAGGEPFPDLATAAAAPVAPERPRSVPLAKLFAADVPGNAWRRFAQESVTVLVHRPDEGQPDALVYAEAWSDLAATSPGAEMRRFLLTVDPLLVGRQAGWSPELSTLAAGLGGAGSSGRATDRQAVGLAMTRTGGKGIGYTSSAASFSGWRWVGRNRNGVFLRLAMSRGSWGEPVRLDPALRPAAERLVKLYPALDWMRAAMDAGEASGHRRGVEPAYMVLGSAGSSDGNIHLALVCARRPSCVPVRDLATILDTLRPAGPAESGDTAGEELPLTDLEYEDGLDLVIQPRSAILPPP